VIDPKPGHRVIGVSLVWRAGAPCWWPIPRHRKCRMERTLAEIAVEAAGVARKLGYEAAHRAVCRSRRSAIRPASAPPMCRCGLRILDQQRVDFEYDGEMAADVAAQSRPDGGLPVLPPVPGPPMCCVMPRIPFGGDLDQMLRSSAARTVIGPLLVGLDNRLQIREPVLEGQRTVVNMAALAAYNVSG